VQSSPFTYKGTVSYIVGEGRVANHRSRPRRRGAHCGASRGGRGRGAKLLIVAACLCGAVALAALLEFHYWFHNNKLPAYIRWGFAGQEGAALEVFYRAGHEACRVYHPQLVQECEIYQQGLLTRGPMLRLFASVAAMLLGMPAPVAGFMPSLKFAIVWLGLGGAIVGALIAALFLWRLPLLGIAAFATTLSAGWVATRLMHTEFLRSSIPVLPTLGLLATAATVAMSLRPFPAITLKV
jgi:hypothetical protein